MIWLTWRQFRAQALTVLALLAAAAIYFLVTGLPMHHTYTADLASCTPLDILRRPCSTNSRATTTPRSISPNSS